MLRIDGRTIREDETYSGRIVLGLLKTSYDNGYRRGLLDATQMKEASFLIEDMMCEIEDLRAENKDLRWELNEAYNH